MSRNLKELWWGLGHASTRHPGILTALSWRRLSIQYKQKVLFLISITPSHSPIFLALVPWNKSLNPPVRNAPSYTGRKGAPFIFKDKRTQKNPNKYDLQISPWFIIHTYLIPFTLHIFPWLCTKLGVKIHRFNGFFGSSFPHEDSHDM